MPDWMKVVHRLGLTLEELHDTLKWRLKRSFGGIDPVCIQPYLGHGNAREVYLKGRVLERKELKSGDDIDSVWDNLVAMYRRFESDEIPEVRLRARFGDSVQDVVTDREGYFELIFPVGAPLPTDRDRHPIELELLEEVVEGQGPVRATGEVIVPPPDAGFGVISDIDDTIIRTFSAEPLKAIQTTLLNNARTRLPFKGGAGFYRALRGGPGGISRNPIFYVSSSPWNLYDLLIDFIQINEIPAGPLFLQDLGIDWEKFIKLDNADHKLELIRHIMNAHASLPFVLIGDSGEHDPEIYVRVVEEYPDRIKAIYIRDVSLDERDAEVRTIAAGLGERKVEMLLVPDTEAAARHALAHGLIAPDKPAEVRAEKQRDESLPEPQDDIAES